MNNFVGPREFETISLSELRVCCFFMYDGVRYQKLIQHECNDMFWVFNINDDYCTRLEDVKVIPLTAEIKLSFE